MREIFFRLLVAMRPAGDGNEPIRRRLAAVNGVCAREVERVGRPGLDLPGTARRLAEEQTQLGRRKVDAADRDAVRDFRDDHGELTSAVDKLLGAVERSDEEEMRRNLRCA